MSRRKSSEAENPFWITYSDLLSSLFMIILVLLFAFQGLSMIQSQQLKEYAKELEKQKKSLEDAKQELEKDQAALTKDAESFQNLLKDLKNLQKAFEDQDVEIDEETGNLKIPEKILFEAKGGTEVLPEGKKFLKGFVPMYARVVTDQQYDNIILGVVFEGHADTRGPSNDDKNYFDNMFVTTERSYNVNQFVLKSIGFDDKAQKNRFRRLIAVAGRSNIEARDEFKRKPKQDSEMHLLDNEKFRRVDIKLVLKNPIYKWGQERK